MRTVGRASSALSAPLGRSAREQWPHHLPRALTSFIGRKREIAEARRLLGETRLPGSHVKHILAKLVFDSRVQIATWAIEHGLHRLSSPN
jgi:hypothetical protein